MTVRWGRWFWGHRQPVLVHGSILLAFLLFCLFLSPGLFARLEDAGNAPRAVDAPIPLPDATEDIQFRIDSFVRGTQMLEIQGWAFVDGPGCATSRTYIVLLSGDTHFAFDTVAQLRMDVTKSFGGLERDLDWSGFLCSVPAGAVVNGQYAVAILIEGVDEAFLRTTGTTVEKSDTGFLAGD